MFCLVFASDTLSPSHTKILYRPCWVYIYFPLSQSDPPPSLCRTAKKYYDKKTDPEETHSEPKKESSKTKKEESNKKPKDKSKKTKKEKKNK